LTQLVEEEEVLRELFQLCRQVGPQRVGQEDLAEEPLQVIHKLEAAEETLEVMIHLKVKVEDKIIHYNQVELVAEEHHKVVLLVLL
jgi:hypothetical protein